MMKDEESARFLSGSLNLLKGVSGLLPKEEMSQSDQEAIRAFQSMVISREKDVLSIKLMMEEKDLTQ